MTYRALEKKELENFLRANTTYDVDLIFRTKPFNQIAGMCKRIETAMKNYPKEIIEYLRKHPEKNIGLTDQEIYALSYNDLVALRKELGIKTSRKKVTEEKTADKTAQLGIDFIESQETRQLCFSIISQNCDDRDLQILTEKEIREMYGGEELSKDDLARRGIVSDAVDYSENEDPEEERYIMFDEIISSKVTISGQELTFDFLYSLGEEELKSLHTIATNFIQYTKANRSPKK